MEMPDLSKERISFVGDLKGNERIYRHLIHRYGGTTTHTVSGSNSMLVIGYIDPELMPLHPRIVKANQFNVKLIQEADFMRLLNPVL